MRAASNSFNYSLEACRRYQSRGSILVQPMHLAPGGSPQGTMAPPMDGSVNLYADANQMNAGNTFRGDQSYVYAGRDYALQNWNQGNAGFTADANMGYNMYQQPFPSLAVQDPSYLVSLKIAKKAYKFHSRNAADVCPVSSGRSHIGFHDGSISHGPGRGGCVFPAEHCAGITPCK